MRGSFLVALFLALSVPSGLVAPGSVHAQEEPREEMPAEPPEWPEVTEALQERRASMEFTNADVRVVFDLVRRQLGLNGILLSGVEGTVDVDLRRVVGEEVLDRLTDQVGVDWRVLASAVVVGPAGDLEELGEGYPDFVERPVDAGEEIRERDELLRETSVSCAFTEGRIADVLRVIAAQAGMELAGDLPENLEPVRVTLELRELPAHDALFLALAPLGYRIRIQADGLRVIPAD